MVVCFIDGEFTAKYLNLNDKDKGAIWLHSANKKYEPIKITAENDFINWGVVIDIVKKPRKMEF